MKSIKSHLSLTIALFSIIFTIQLFTVILGLIEAYEEKLKNNYAMILISHAKIDKSSLSHVSQDIIDLKPITSDEILNELSSDLDKQQQTLLKATLPNFYELKLGHFPNPNEIQQIKKALLSIKGITKIESFSNRHDQIYKLLLLMKWVVNIFGVLILTVAILVILKEMRLWQFEHKDRMQIMALFGSPIWLRSAVLFKFAIFDAIFATIIVLGTYLYIQQHPLIVELLKSIDLSIVMIHPLHDGMILLGIALATSLTLALSLVFQRHSV